MRRWYAQRSEADRSAVKRGKWGAPFPEERGPPILYDDCLGCWRGSPFQQSAPKRETTRRGLCVCVATIVLEQKRVRGN